MKNEELLNYAIDNIDQRYVDETAEALYSRTGKERRLYEIKVTRSPAPKKKSYKWAVGIAASVAVVAGIGTIAAVLPKTEWGRPSAASEGIEITLPVTEKPVIETDPITYETEEEVFEEPIPEDEICDYPGPPAHTKGSWIGGNGGDYMYAVNYNDDGGTGKIIAFNTVTGETITKVCDEGSSVAGIYKNGVIVLKTGNNSGRIASTAVYDESLNFLYEAAVPDEEYNFIQPQWDGKYLWEFYDDNESLKRNDRSCAIYLYTPNGSSEPVYFKSITLPQYICSVVYANYDENKDEIAFFGQKFAEGTDVSEGFKSVFCIINATTGEVTFEREYDEYYFSKAYFDGGLMITLMRKTADNEREVCPIILYDDGTECDFGSLVSATGACSISPNGKYFAIQGGHSITGGNESIRNKYSIMVYEINNRTLSDTPKVCYAAIDYGANTFVGNNGLVYGVADEKLELFIPIEANLPEITLDEVYAIAERADSITIEELLGKYKAETGSEVYSFVCPVSGDLPLLVSVGDSDGKDNPDTIYLGSYISDHAVNLKTLAREDIELYVDTIETLKSIKEYVESEISERIDTIEEHKAYLAELEEEKANAEDHKAKLKAKNEDTTGNNPEKIGAYEEEIRILEKNIAAIDVKIEEAKERIKKFEATISELKERANETLGVSSEEEAESPEISLFFPLDQKKWIITTPYSESDPWTGGTGHQAVDYSGEPIKGDDVYAEIVGTVKTEDKEDYYNVYITDEKGSEAMICNLYEIYVKDGDVVNKGDPIGANIANSIMNANVYAAISGTVIDCDDDIYYPPYDKGKYIVIKDENGVQTLYSHLSAVHVKKGDKVEKGDLIGAVGSTGFSTGPHLHFEVTVNGNPIDPTLYYEN